MWNDFLLLSSSENHHTWRRIRTQRFPFYIYHEGSDWNAPTLRKIKKLCLAKGHSANYPQDMVWSRFQSVSSLIWRHGLYGYYRGWHAMLHLDLSSRLHCIQPSVFTGHSGIEDLHGLGCMCLTGCTVTISESKQLAFICRYIIISIHFLSIWSNLLVNKFPLLNIHHLSPTA